MGSTPRGPGSRAGLGSTPALGHVSAVRPQELQDQWTRIMGFQAGLPLWLHCRPHGGGRHCAACVTGQSCCSRVGWRWSDLRPVFSAHTHVLVGKGILPSHYPRGCRCDPGSASCRSSRRELALSGCRASTVAARHPEEPQHQLLPLQAGPNVQWLPARPHSSTLQPIPGTSRRHTEGCPACPHLSVLGIDLLLSSESEVCREAVGRAQPSVQERGTA